VLRHESNVSVMKGRQGGISRTHWLMNYSGFERIYYETVANFEYWSGDIPRLETLVFFNYLRQEFEDNFLLLLPEDERQKIREDWTQGIGQIALDLEPFAGEEQPTQVKTARSLAQPRRRHPGAYGRSGQRPARPPESVREAGRLLKRADRELRRLD
jgi:hypothetical protein